MHFHPSHCSLPWNRLHPRAPCPDKINSIKPHIFLPSNQTRTSKAFRKLQEKALSIIWSLTGREPIPEPIMVAGGLACSDWCGQDHVPLPRSLGSFRWSMKGVRGGGKASSGCCFDKNKMFLVGNNTKIHPITQMKQLHQVKSGLLLLSALRVWKRKVGKYVWCHKPDFLPIALSYL